MKLLYFGLSEPENTQKGSCTIMEKLYAGFGRANVTPMLGIKLRGYYQERLADGVLDELEANAVAFTCGDNTAVFVALDLCSMPEKLVEGIRAAAAAATGIDGACIHVSAIHSHTAPFCDPDVADPIVQEYTNLVIKKTADAIRMALDDRKESKMGWAVGNAPNIAFIRRFRMKDGSIRTNPGVNNPDIVAPIGEVDERVERCFVQLEDVVLVLEAVGGIFGGLPVAVLLVVGDVACLQRLNDGAVFEALNGHKGGFVGRGVEVAHIDKHSGLNLSEGVGLILHAAVFA
jgi:hypothetical protein